MFTFPVCQFSPPPSGGPTPWSLSYPSGLDLFLDGTDAATITLATAPKFSNWTDRSPSANHAFQSNVTDQLAFNTNPINGKSSVTFDASTSFMNLTTPIPAANSTGFVFGNYNGSTSTGGWLGNNVVGTGLYFGNYNGVMYLFDSSGNVNAPFARDGTPRLYYFTSANNNLSIFADNTTVGSGGFGSTASSITRIGARGGSEFVDGNAQVILHYDHILNGTEIAAVKLRWGNG